MRLFAAPRILALAAASVLVLATSAAAQYVGVTVETFDGAQGVFTYNRACHAAHPGSRMCTSKEIFETINPPVVGDPGELAWVRPTYQPTGTTNMWDISGQTVESTCASWSRTIGNGFAVTLDKGAFTGNGDGTSPACSTSLRIACCIPVPEPSAAVTIPSGAAMVFALAKLRGISSVN